MYSIYCVFFCITTYLCKDRNCIRVFVLCVSVCFCSLQIHMIDTCVCVFLQQFWYMTKQNVEKRRNKKTLLWKPASRSEALLGLDDRALSKAFGCGMQNGYGWGYKMGRVLRKIEFLLSREKGKQEPFSKNAWHLNKSFGEFQPIYFEIGPKKDH